MPRDIVDIQSLRLSDRAETPDADNGATLRGRPWLAVHWKCCSTYSRIYRNRKGDAYEGRCPRCASPVRARIGTNGTSARFFEVE